MCIWIKRPLDFSSGLVYNLVRKHIGHEFRLPSVVDYENSILTLGGRDAIFFYYDCQGMTEPQILLTIKIKLHLCSLASPPYVLEGIEKTHPAFFLITRVDYNINANQ